MTHFFEAAFGRISGSKPGRWFLGHYQYFWLLIDRRPALRAVVPMLAGLLLLWLTKWVESGYMTRPLSFWLLPVPVLLYLYLRRTEHDSEGLVTAAPLPVAGFAIAAFILSALTYGYWQMGWLLAAIGASAFTFMPFNALRDHVARHSKLAVAAALAGFSGLLYILAQIFLWKWLTTATASTILLFLDKFIPYMSVFEKGQRFIYGTVPHIPFHRFHRQVPVRIYYRVNPNRPLAPKPPPPPEDPHVYLNFMAVGSDHGVMRFYMFENVLNGMVLFIFMLSVALLVRGQPQRRGRLPLYYGAGLLLIFVVNALAMTLFYLFGYVAFAPGSGGVMLGLGKVLGALLSSRFVCLAAYAALALLFITWLYKPEAFRFLRLRRRVRG